MIFGAPMTVTGVLVTLSPVLSMTYGCDRDLESSGIASCTMA